MKSSPYGGRPILRMVLVARQCAQITAVQRVTSFKSESNTAGFFTASEVIPTEGSCAFLASTATKRLRASHMEG